MKPLTERLRAMRNYLAEGNHFIKVGALEEAIKVLEDSAEQPSEPQSDDTNRYFIMEETVYGPHRVARNCWKLYDKMMVSKFGTTRRPLAYFYSQDIATHTCMMMNGTDLNSKEHVLRERLGKAIHDAAKLATARDELRAAYEKACGERDTFRAQAHVDREAADAATRVSKIQAQELQAIEKAAKGRYPATPMPEYVTHLEQILGTLRSDKLTALAQRDEFERQRTDFKRLWETSKGFGPVQTHEGYTAKEWHDRAAAVQNYMDAAGAKLIAIRKVLES